MTKKQIVTSSFLLSFVAGFLLWAVNPATSEGLTGPQKPRSRPSEPRPSEIPEHIFYGEVFSLLTKLKNTGDYGRRAALSDEEVALLERIARECESDVTEQDRKAEAFSEAFRQKLPKSKPANRPLPVPAELTEFQEARDAIVLRHRDRLRRALGEDAFRRFAEAAKSIVNVTLEPIS
ncbi:MAG: hypothetical protein AABN95_22820 [Acidobacteriota bacterium]